MIEINLIKLKDTATPEDVLRVARMLEDFGTEVIMVSHLKKWLIAPLDQQMAVEVRKLRTVELLGGITLSEPHIPVIQSSEK
ncbi:hypothetical protein RJ53_10410 [Methanocalculus chunghsingensis]|uniref:Uncharacterized protein n=1 Tax=Methanocalculus chunghsingensis TaxID=156457 RepID=A0A8J8B7N8_9EURY|nr:hypothetical protein [Methanocalculus chunghsingensis]MBR1369867.1 hypothetical protein [Methanocalculus chunghsingensis]